MAPTTNDWRDIEPARWPAWLRDQPASALCEILDAFLQERATDGDRLPALYDALRRHSGPRGQGTMALAQINTAPGDITGNARKIMRYIAAAEAIGVDMVVFPELALMGYPIRDAIVRFPFLADENLRWLEAIAARTGETYALVGFVEPRRASGDAHRPGKDFFNSMAVLGQGEIKALVRKSVLPTYNEFEDDRQFEAAPASGAHHPQTLGMAEWGFSAPAPSGNPYMIHGRNYGLSICEDMWADPTFFEKPLYRRDPIAELAMTHPHAFVNISASPTRSRKEQLKHNLLSHLARRHQRPFVYVNQVGSVDEVSFDGGSRAYDAQGRLIARARLFAEQFLMVNPFRGEGPVHPLPAGLEATLEAQKVFDAYDESDLGRTYESILQGIRDYFGKTGFERAVIGLSGGLDSSVTVVLLADALGPDKVLGVSMPSGITPAENRDDARQLARNLGIRLVESPIGAIVDAIESAVGLVQADIEAGWGPADSRSNARDNAQAITRATLLRQIGNEFRALPIATSDKSELYLGYATVNGDMSGALAPLGDLPKTKVRALARWLNAHRPVRDVLPDNIMTKPSGADLKVNPDTGQLITAEEDLMPYEFADEVIWRIEALRQDYTAMLEAPFQYERKVPLSREQKAAWLQKFFHRMARAVFKWFISPPILIMEGNGSIAKSDYHHPLTASRIDWQGKPAAEIDRLLDGSIAQITGPPGVSTPK